MGTTETAITKISDALDEQERTYSWLARRSGVPYKRLLAEIKHRTRPLTLETALAAGRVVGLELPELVADRKKPAAVVDDIQRSAQSLGVAS